MFAQQNYRPQHVDQTTRHGWAILNLMNRTGREILQENGQRKYCPPSNWTGPPPPKGCEVFVGHLPRNVFEDELVPLFEQIGPIYQLRLMMDFSGTSRGYGFVEYTCPEHAVRAVRDLNDHEIRPKKYIGVVMSKDNCRLFVGKIPKDKSAEEIREEMSYYTENVVDVIVHPSFRDNSKNRGFAFVEYASHRDAAMARRKLLPGKFLLFGSEVQVDWAEPEPEVDPVTMARVTNLYVRNVHPDLENEDLLADLFSFPNRTFGQGPLLVIKAKKMKDFAFIHYATREQAETAMRLAKSDEYFGQRLSSDGTRLHVTWAKPPDRFHAARRDSGRFSHPPGNHLDNYSAPRRPYVQHHGAGNQTGSYGTSTRSSTASDMGWSTQSMMPLRPASQLFPDQSLAARSCVRGSQPMYDWSSQSQASGDHNPHNHFSSIWTPGPSHSMTPVPFALPSPAASPIMSGHSFHRMTPSPALRTDSPFMSSPNPFPTFARF